MRSITKNIIVILIVALVVFLIYFFSGSSKVTNFEECVLAGNPVMESYPRQCNHNGKNFIEVIGDEVDEKDGTFKIIYGTETVDDTIIYELDCSRRNGNFNTCGSICAKEEICAAVCAYTCEGLRR